MRQEFRDIVSGWTLYSGIDDLTDRIERAAEWTKKNGPLHADEEATIKLMIEAQIARGGFHGLQGDLEPRERLLCNVCGVRMKTDDEEEMGMCQRCADA